MAGPAISTPKHCEIANQFTIQEGVSKTARTRLTTGAGGYRTFVRDANHPSLQFKQVHPSKPIFSARVGLGYRALAVRDADDLIWFWIGSHAEYDRLISNQ